MIGNETVLGVILARGGSKGIPKKNLQTLARRPLIAWTIDAGLDARTIDRLVLSSDDEEIMQEARDRGCEVPFRRPDALARDDSTSMEALLHVLDHVGGFDWVVLLQPTSPLRVADDIDDALQQCIDRGAPACVSVTPVEEPPQWMYTLTDREQLRPLLDGPRPSRRQNATTAYVLNGAVYAARIPWLRNTGDFISSETVAHAMPVERSADVDTKLDLRWCDFLLRSARPLSVSISKGSEDSEVRQHP